MATSLPELVVVAFAGALGGEPRVEVVALRGAEQRLVGRDVAVELIDELEHAVLWGGPIERSRQQVVDLIDADGDR